MSLNKKNQYNDLAKKYYNDHKNYIKYLNQIRSEWEHFTSIGSIKNTTCLRQEVLHSWKRSYKKGVNPYNLNLKTLKSQDFNKKLEKNRILIEVASPFLQEFISNYQNSEIRIDLLDQDLCILKQFGGDEIMNITKNQGMSIGTSRQESITGTNAINLSSFLRKPVHLDGSEHYNEKFHYWMCSATPLYNNISKELIGVLNVAGNYYITQKETFGLVIALSKTIENFFNKYTFFLKNIDNINLLESLSTFIPDGLIIINNSGIITLFNYKASIILQLDPEDVINKNFKEVFGPSSTIFESFHSKSELYNKEIIFNIHHRTINVMGHIILIKNKEINYLLYLNEMVDNQQTNTRISFTAFFRFRDIIGNNPVLKETIKLSKTVAQTDSNILILGESGTGKELFAQSIHNASKMKNGPFVGLNCSALPSNLLESELYGYEDGSFTGSKKGGKIGKLQLAENGTLFLDEICTLPFQLQSKLLRALQNRSFISIGGTKELFFNARIITASNKDLWEEVLTGNFREDLFFRLNVISLEIPPLRKRIEDIPELVNYILKRLSKQFHLEINITPKAIHRMMDYTWPGNIRELENFIERCVIILKSKGDYIIKEKDVLNYPGIARLLGEEEENKERIQLKAASLEDVEKNHIEISLKKYGYNISETAKILGISRNTLYNKMKKYNL